MFPHIFTTFLLAIHSPLLYFYIPDIRYLEKSQVTNNLIVDIQNAQRVKNNLVPLAVDPLLSASAQKKACEIEQSKNMTHKNFYLLIYQNGYNKKAAVGENLAQGLNQIQTSLGWLGCDRHRGLILDPQFKKVGIGSCGNYTVEHFGSL